MKIIISHETVHWLYFVITYICFLSFWHSSRVVFKVTDNTNSKSRLLLKVVSVLSWNSLPLHFFLTENTTSAIFYNTGLFLSFASLTMYWLSVKSLANYKLSVIHGQIENNQIYKKGLYKYIRHPFYTAYLLCYSGVLLSYPSFIHTFLVVALFSIYTVSALKEESYFLSGSLKSEYKNYKLNTGMFYPKLFKKI